MSKYTAKEYQIWWDPGWEKMLLSEWNACGCHPGDLIETWGHHSRCSGWYGKKDREEMTKYRIAKGWILLDSSPQPAEKEDEA